MKKIRKVLITIIGLSLFITTLASAYGWFTLQPSTEALDLNARTSELFGSSLAIRLTSGTANNQMIDYNHTTFYNRDDLAVVLTRDQINENNFNLKIDVNITAYQNINVRFKTVEMWIGTNGRIVNNPNVFNYAYGTGLVEQNSSIGTEYVVGNPIVKDASTSINYITGLTRKPSTTVPSNIQQVRILVIASAIQLNRSDIWDEQIEEFKSLTITGPNDQGYKVNVNFNEVANEMYKRGLAIEFVNESYQGIYLWHTRNLPSGRLINLNPGTYQISINTVNHLTFSVVQSGTNINITIHYDTNQTPSTWAYEDTIFGPNAIHVYNQSNPGGYRAGDIVYYNDPNGTLTGYYIAVRDQTGWVQPINNTHYWRELTIEYQGGQYFKDDIIYYQGMFWIALVDTYTTPPSWGAWQILDRLHVRGNQYDLGDVVYTMDGNGNKIYYYASTSSSLNNSPADSNGWRMISNQYEEINKGDSNYRIGEIVYHQGNYYRAVINGWKYAAPGGSQQVWQLLVFNPYNSAQSYAKDSTVSYNGNLYYARASIAPNQIPGISGQWQELTNEWRAHNVYANNLIKSFIITDDKIYMWRGADNSNSLTPPGSERNGWFELTNIWVPENTYNKGEFVIYDGSFWELITDDPYPAGVQSVPGVDFNIWKEYQINWDPNRS